MDADEALEYFFALDCGYARSLGSDHPSSPLEIPGVKGVSEPDGLSEKEENDSGNQGAAQPPVGRGTVAGCGRGTVCANCGRRKGGWGETEVQVKDKDEAQVKDEDEDKEVREEAEAE